MKKIVVYHNPRCGKSRGACSLLNESKLPYETIEYLKTPPSEAELKKLLRLLGIKPIDLIRKKEEAYIPFKNQKLSDQELIQLMIDHPILIERPIVVIDGKAIIARPPELLNDFLTK